MKIGVIFPQTEIGADPAIIREYATTAESLGYDHIVAFDHVLGANTASRPDWQGPYTSASMFHEPLLLFSHLAAITKTIEFVTAVIILPQRQTALVAKQAACLDVLSGGRLRLGIGTGWNAVEYEALGENFHNRGKRSEEQIEVMRQLWRDEAVTFDGRYHKITDAGLNPRPERRTIPIWLGGRAPQVLERVGKIGDGWFPMFGPDDYSGKAMIDQVRETAKEAGRDPSSIGIETFLPATGSADKDLERLKRWQDFGVSHIAINTMNQDLGSPRDHIGRITDFREVVEKLG